MRSSVSTSLVVATLFATFGTTALFAQEQTFTAQAWGDNWFEFYVDGEVVMTDSEPLMKEQSFNAEDFSFKAELPAQIAVVLMDYKEDDSGFEYIGSRRQQMGDGGFIAEIRNEDGELVAATGSDWLCKVIHQAPLNPSCGSSDNPLQACESNILPMPSGWTEAGFDDSGWMNAVVHSSGAVRPRGGYSYYSWDSSSKLIWGEDLEIDNTILCRYTLN